MSEATVFERRKIIGITWEQHRRTRGLCSGIGVTLFELVYDRGGLRRYLVLAWRTLRVILNERPDVLLVQNPSLILSILALTLRPLMGYKLAIDAHNEAVQPFIHTQWPIPAFSRLSLKCADLTIVTNSQLAAAVNRVGGRVFILPDALPPPPITPSGWREESVPLEIMVIATYAPDEPIRAILTAAAAVGLNFRFYITGNDRKLSAADRKMVPENVCLTGFLSEADYWRLMDRCHLVLDLSLMPDCVVCGAYEALAMGRPMILSDNAAIRELFGSVAVVTSGEAIDIERALLAARECYESLAHAVPAAGDLFRNSWLTKAELLKSSLSRL